MTRPCAHHPGHPAHECPWCFFPENDPKNAPHRDLFIEGLRRDRIEQAAAMRANANAISKARRSR